MTCSEQLKGRVIPPPMGVGGTPSRGDERRRGLRAIGDPRCREPTSWPLGTPYLAGVDPLASLRQTHENQGRSGGREGHGS